MLTIIGGWVPLYIIGIYISNKIKLFQRAIIGKDIISLCNLYNNDLNIFNEKYASLFEMIGFTKKDLSLNFSITRDEAIAIINWIKFFDKNMKEATFYPHNYLNMTKEEYGKLFKKIMIIATCNSNTDIYYIAAKNYSHNLSTFVEGLTLPITDPVHQHHIESNLATAKGIKIDFNENIIESARLSTSEEHKRYVELLGKSADETHYRRELCSIIKSLVLKAKNAKADIIINIHTDALKLLNNL